LGLAHRGRLRANGAVAALTLSRGVLITFEGGEGAGKSTQIGRLAERLAGELGLAADRVVRVREPGGTVLGEGIREILKRPESRIGGPAEALLFAACRSQLVEDVIRPSLAAGKVVLCDRFADSTVAYQGGGRELPSSLVESVNRLACREVRPDLTVLLDLDPAAGLARASARDSGKADRLEALDLAFHRRVRDAYLAMARAEPARFLVLDATRPPAEVAEAIWHEVRRRLA
jgi:dTMP kinase